MAPPVSGPGGPAPCARVPMAAPARGSLLLESGGFRRGSAVRPERPGGRELTQLVAYHILGHVDGNEFLPVMHCQCVSHELRGDGGSPRPGLDDLAIVAPIHLFDLLVQLRLDVRPLLQRSPHLLTSSCRPSAGFGELRRAASCPEGEA